MADSERHETTKGDTKDRPKNDTVDELSDVPRVPSDVVSGDVSTPKQIVGSSVDELSDVPRVPSDVVSGDVTTPKQIVGSSGAHGPLPDTKDDSTVPKQVEDTGGSVRSPRCATDDQTQTMPPKYRPNCVLTEGEPLSIVLVGKTGNGKSATGNTIFGKHHLFKSSPGTKSQTKTCQLEHGLVAGREIHLVDTPGNMDTRHPKECLQAIGSAIYMCPDGYDAVLFILKFGNRMTEEEKKSVREIRKLFGEDIFSKYVVIVFTYGDNYDGVQPFGDFILEDADGFLRKLIIECNRRVVLLNNNFKYAEAESFHQVSKLMEIIDQLRRCNNGLKYNNDFFKDAKALHLEMEETDKSLREQLYKEQEELDEQLQTDENAKLKKGETERLNKMKEIKEQQILKAEHFGRKLNDIIEKEQDESKTRLRGLLSRHIEQLQKVLVQEAEDICENNERKFSALLEKDQELKLELNTDKDMRTSEEELTALFTLSADSDGSLKECWNRFREKVNEKKKTNIMMWDSKVSEVFGKKVKELRAFTKDTVSELENEWLQDMEQRSAEHLSDTDKLISEKKEDVLERVKVMFEAKTHLDNWRDEMDTVQDGEELQCRNSITDILSERKGQFGDMIHKISKQNKEDRQKKLDAIWSEKYVEMHQSLVQEKYYREKKWKLDTQKDIASYSTEIQARFKKEVETRQIDAIMTPVQQKMSSDREILLQRLSDTLKSTRITAQEKWSEIITQLPLPSVKLRSEGGLKRTMMQNIQEQRNIYRNRWIQATDTTTVCQTETNTVSLNKSYSAAKKKWAETLRETLLTQRQLWKEKLSRLSQEYAEVMVKQIDETLKTKILKRNELLHDITEIEEEWGSELEQIRNDFESKWEEKIKRLSSNVDFRITEEDKQLMQAFEEKIYLNRNDQEQKWLKVEQDLVESITEILMKKLLDKQGAQEEENKKYMEDEKRKHTDTLKEEMDQHVEEVYRYLRDVIDDNMKIILTKSRGVVGAYQAANMQSWKEGAEKKVTSFISKWFSEMMEMLKQRESEWNQAFEQLKLEKVSQLKTELRTLQSHSRREIKTITHNQLKISSEELNQTLESKRQELKAIWSDHNMMDLNTMMEAALDKAKLASDQMMQETIYEITSKRKLEEQRCELMIKHERLTSQKKQLDEKCLQRFGKRFAEMNACFPVESLVQLSTGQIVSLSEVNIGDRLLCCDEKGMLVYSPVYRFGHRQHYGYNTFVEISTKSKKLKVSPNHHVHTGKSVCRKNTKAAIAVKAGEAAFVLGEEGRLVSEEVLSVTLTTGRGLCAPYTLCGTIVVDGMLASCYVDRVAPSLAHKLLAPVRVWYRLFAPGASTTARKNHEHVCVPRGPCTIVEERTLRKNKVE